MATTAQEVNETNLGVQGRYVPWEKKRIQDRDMLTDCRAWRRELARDRVDDRVGFLGIDEREAEVNVPGAAGYCAPDALCPSHSAAVAR